MRHISTAAVLTRSAALLALFAWGAAGCGSSSAVARLASTKLVTSQAAAGPAAGGLAQPAAKEPFRFFAPTSFWNTPLAASEPVAPNSAELVAALDAEIASMEQAGTGPWIDTKSWSVPIYTVPRDQPTVRVQISPGPSSRALQRAWDAVPLPPDAQPAGGTDGHLVVWQPSRDRLWEFWRLRHGAGGWLASWGGAMRNVSTSSGIYGPKSWPGAKPWWGASATSLSVAGGLITLEDLQSGAINHALAMSIANVRAGVYAAPANRDDGQSTSPLSLPEGARLRLNPALNLAALHLPKLTLLIAQAAQRYGIVVRDRSFNVAFFAQDPVSTGSEPYTGAGGYFEGMFPNQLLASFPWSQLEVLRLELSSNGRGSRLGRRALGTGAASVPAPAGVGASRTSG
jgi:hypothetical protein